MRLIDADEYKKYLVSCKEIYEKCNDSANADRLKTMIGHLDGMTTIDAEPVEYQPMSKDFARMITKAIASLLSELHLDLPSLIYEDIESNLLKGKFTDVEWFVQNYLKNNGAKMNMEAEQ